MDGISLVMIALIALLVPIVLGASWEERLPEGRTIGGYFALILVMQAAMTGVFAATDVFVFYVMFEVMLIPMYFLIGAFGGLRGTYAATKFFLYSLLGGLLMLASHHRPVRGVRPVPSGSPPASAARWTGRRCAAIAHEIPTSHPVVDLRRIRHRLRHQGAAGAASTPGCPTPVPRRRSGPARCWSACWTRSARSASCASACRCCLPRRSKLAWLIITLAVIGILYGAIVAAGQSDMKRFVTYTSIAHFGFIALGVFAFTTQAISGAVLYMVNHGLATALLFLVVGMLTARGGSGAIARLRRGLEGRADAGRVLPDRLAGHHRDARHELVRLRVPGADRHFHPVPGLVDHRHHRHRAARPSTCSGSSSAR